MKESLEEAGSMPKATYRVDVTAGNVAVLVQFWSLCIFVLLFLNMNFLFFFFFSYIEQCYDQVFIFWEYGIFLLFIEWIDKQKSMDNDK